MKKVSLVCVLSFLLIASNVAAATHILTPQDAEGWTILENAEPGDIVEIAPGTYQFRVYLSKAASADNPIIIRAQDPNNRPVWDLVGDSISDNVENWPGSYTAGDRGRGAWQVGQEGAHYEISGIVFRNCRGPSSAGIRMINCGPVTIRDCLFESNTNGLTGTSEDLVVEFSEFYNNGKTINDGNMTHNIYIYGGKFTLRYSYSHDPHEGQLFHIRAYDALLEYNWFARPSSYVGDMMTCNNLCGPEPFSQKMVLRGNVIIQGDPQNGSQVIALYNDEGQRPEMMDITLLFNTIIGTARNPGQSHFLLNFRNDSVDTHGHVFNNIIYNVGDIMGVRDEDQNNWSIEGSNNWVTAGTGAGALTENIEGTDPGFADFGGLDFTLTDNCDADEAADTDVGGAPGKEYYINETESMKYRRRDSANDLGAFETGNQNPSIGPYDTDTDPSPEDTDFPDSDPEPGTDPDSENSGGETGIEPDSDTDSVDCLGDDGCGCNSVGTTTGVALISVLVFIFG